jgi:hypothetical protein
MEETLFNDFQSLPEAIKTWLASDHCAIYVSEINKKLGLKGNRRRIIPTLVLRLVTQDLEPQDFIKELAGELNVSYPIAKSLTEEIEAKILHPIELGLRRDVGVDIKLIYFEETAEKSIPTAPITPKPSPAPTPSISPFAPVIPPLPTDLSAKSSATTEALSKKESPSDISAKEEQPAVAPRVIYQERSLENAPTPAFQTPPPAEIPAPIQPAKPEIKPVSARIVHYSNLITPLVELNEDKNFDSFVVDLRNA